MKFDTVVIGCGLAGMTAAIYLAESGKKVAVVASGQSAMHFNSGSFGLLGFDQNHNRVPDIVEAVAELHDNHPYKRFAPDELSLLMSKSQRLLSAAGLNFSNKQPQHDRISPLGLFAPAWMTLDGIATREALVKLPDRKIAVIGIAGFLDFYPRFIASSLCDTGFECVIKTVDTVEIRRARTSETEMRAPNLSRILRGKALDNLAAAINETVADDDFAAILFPAVVGSENAEDFGRLRRAVSVPLFYVPTVGASVPGIMIHRAMLRRFTNLGGIYIKGDTVNGALLNGCRLSALTTEHLDGDCLEADNFVFAAGSFFTRGLKALPDRIIEPALGLDVETCCSRDELFADDLFGTQPYMKSGVKTDNNFRAMKDGNVIENLYVAGSALAGADSLREASGAGVAMLTALKVADSILNIS